jgi:hypothetical protein
MAVLTNSVVSGAGGRPITVNTLANGDTLVYNPGTNQRLVLLNNTAGSLTPTITGSAAPSGYNAPGGPINVNLGAAVQLGGPLAIGAARQINLDSIANHLQGTISLAACAGLTAFLLSDN